MLHLVQYTINNNPYTRENHISCVGVGILALYIIYYDISHSSFIRTYCLDVNRSAVNIVYAYPSNRVHFKWIHYFCRFFLIFFCIDLDLWMIMPYLVDNISIIYFFYIYFHNSSFALQIKEKLVYVKWRLVHFYICKQF